MTESATVSSPLAAKRDALLAQLGAFTLRRIRTRLRLLRLPPEVREHLASGTISTGHAKVLLGIADAAQRALLGRRF